MALCLLVNNDSRFVRACCLHPYGVDGGSKTFSVMETVSFSEALGIEN